LRQLFVYFGQWRNFEVPTEPTGYLFQGSSVPCYLLGSIKQSTKRGTLRGNSTKNRQQQKHKELRWANKIVVNCAMKIRGGASFLGSKDVSPAVSLLIFLIQFYTFSPGPQLGETNLLLFSVFLFA